MDNNIKKYHQAFLLFTIAQLFMMLGLFQYGGSIKALAGILSVFSLFQDITFLHFIK